MITKSYLFLGDAEKQIVPNWGRFDLYWSNLPLKFFHKKKKMTNNNHLPFVPFYNRTMLKQNYYNEIFKIGQQKYRLGIKTSIKNTDFYKGFVF